MAGGDTDDGDAEFVGALDHFGLLEHDDVADGEGEAASAIGVHVFEGVDADGRDIAAAVVAGAGALAEGPAFGAAEAAGAGDHFVGAFDGFDGDDIAFADGDGLADVEAEGFAEHGPDEVDIAALFGGGAGAGHDARGGEFVWDGGGGVEKGDATAVEFVGDGGEDGV